MHGDLARIRARRGLSDDRSFTDQLSVTKCVYVFGRNFMHPVVAGYGTAIWLGFGVFDLEMGLETVVSAGLERYGVHLLHVVGFGGHDGARKSKRLNLFKGLL